MGGRHANEAVRRRSQSIWPRAGRCRFAKAFRRAGGLDNRHGDGLEQVAHYANVIVARGNDAANHDGAGRKRHGLAGMDIIGHWLDRSEEHTSELQSLMRISYAVFCLKKKKKNLKSI